MLEHDALLLQPWDSHRKRRPQAASNGRAATPTCVILEPATGKVVGLVRPPAPANCFWRRWLNRQRLAVHESEDEPLVCILRRSWTWSSAWEVQDADGRMVGKISKNSLRGSLQRDLIPVRRPDADVTEVRDLQGRTLATVVRQGSDRLVSFASECKGDPFARMLILGAALVDLV